MYTYLYWDDIDGEVGIHGDVHEKEKTEKHKIQHEFIALKLVIYILEVHNKIQNQQAPLA